MNYRKAIFVTGIFALTVTFSQDNPGRRSPGYLKDYLRYDAIYQAAEKLSLDPNYNDETEAREQRMNREALKGFLKILPAVEKDRNDSLAFFCWFKTGTLQHYFDSLGAAQQSYHRAIGIKSKLPQLDDSLLFKPYLFSGSLHYAMNQFDTALADYKRAEQIASLYDSRLTGSTRLYNTLGALYYETGNYRQARNYFEKAIDILPKSDPYYKDLLVNYKVNLASTLIKLEEFDAANAIYQDLLPLNINRNEILHNIGTIYLNLGALQNAIDYFRQVQYNNNRSIRLHNDLGYAFLNMGIYDSASRYFQKALQENEKWFGAEKNVSHGLTYKYIGEENESRDQYEEAIEKYQQAIIQFYGDFNDKDPHANPVSYSGIFSYINLFNTLTAKAGAFEKLYQEKKDIKALEASLDAYQSAFRLADYVERTYDSDEARLFLNKIKYIVHSKPIDVSLLLFDLTGKRRFLEATYLFDQRNKASILSLNVLENELRNEKGGTGLLSKEESVIKSAITRLSLRAAQVVDSSSMSAIKSSIRDYEIQLGKLQEQINESTYKDRKPLERIPEVSDLQKRIDNHTAIVSYHLSEDKLLILYISASRFEYRAVPVDRVFFERIDSLKNYLHQFSNSRYDGETVSHTLYHQLIQPIESRLNGLKRLVIIPDDELHYLPFEALQDEQQHYLVERFAIQYLYSTALFESQRVTRSSALLAMAPFTTRSYTDSTGFTFSRLPASGEEVSGLGEAVYTDSLATRQRFLNQANRYGIIHLATHASVNNEWPLRSFITFYPDDTPVDYRLYAREIYNMNLDSTGLIILSACETGTGKLVKGEGLMSLSRAFAYAGCPNIITSLWKAEDKTTAFISQRLHHYLRKGHHKDEALRQAKLDLLNSSDIDPRFKAPNYWAHLVFIGQYEPTRPNHLIWWIGGILAFIIIMLAAIKRKMVKTR